MIKMMFGGRLGEGCAANSGTTVNEVRRRRATTREYMEV
jgi:hypothetical protein